MKKTRRRFTAAFKTKVVIEAIKERESIQELAVRFELHPNQISTWKREFLENADKAFSSDGTGNDQKAKEKEKEDLYKQIGRSSMENEWLKKECFDPC
jgi:transposase